ncbi:hypothetical protein AKJ65_00500 [candidate division MSBL1 archaeon SCGC-AAA259E19]|uniref:RNA 2',3'-cyclic phosphodiesterase n=2 Tax=candidate division MSBL1 TaxID=215777 RepID=A0A133V5R2_9EURY|nr:hypothetical protein AKJ65_00500 [candidate division MSBL1 archaeon SCGC-AAA259E19]KXB01775.1 hypothetical protein AKJ41_00325 [candidate division MSBL1 archaeon SCGC-AAA259O05]
MPRSFVAIDSNEKIRNCLVKIQKSLKRTGADLKLVEPENIHLTLKFLGNVSENRLELVKEKIRNIEKIDSFELQVNGLGVFPRPSFIRVIWAGVSKGEDKTVDLRKKLDKKLAEIDFEPEDKDFTPHFTIARMKSGRAKDEVLSQIEENSDTNFGSVIVKEVKLKKSELTSEGPIYTTLESVELS